MPPQLKRLIPMFVIFIGLFLLARYFLVPESFGKYGHYRADSLEDNAAAGLNYAGEGACAECHDSLAEAKSEDVHTDLACETCHGPGKAHADNPDNASVLKPTGFQLCGLCHSKNPAKNPDMIIQVDIKKHYPEQDCLNCHNPHKPWDLKNQD